jgi:pre-mRNA-splicing factor ATP-dependent RNA helicase DHX38/PRP16
MKELREQKERIKAQKKFWELAGSKTGIAGGELLKDESQKNEEKQPEGPQVPENDHIDYKESAQYSKYLQKKSEAVSEFAKTKTIKEQREFLPIFGTIVILQFHFSFITLVSSVNHLDY